MNNSLKRTRSYFKQLKATIVFKILAILSTFIVVPITINYLGVESYGVWSTLLSLIMWIVYFDLGLGNGLRNKIGIAFAANDMLLAKKYISTAYGLLIIVSSILFVLIAFISFFINFQSLFNTTLLESQQLQYTVLIVLFFILMNFVFSLALQIFYALHKSEMSVVYQFIFNIFILLIVLFLSKFTSPNILYLALGYGISMLLAVILINYLLFREYSQLFPTISFFDIHKIRHLLGLSIQFFIIQSSLLIILSTDKLIITQLFGPKDVTSYDILYKLFTIVLVVHNIILAPMWSSFTDAYEKNDKEWILKSIRNLKLLMIPFSIGIMILIVFSPYIINIWIGGKVKPDFILILFMGIFSWLMVWNNIYGNFSNGVSQVKPQMYAYLTGGILNIPLSILFAKYIFGGVEGIIFASIISLSIFSIVGPLHTKKILKKMVK